MAAFIGKHRRKGFVSLLALGAAVLALPAGASALPGKRVAKATDHDFAYIAGAHIWSTSPNGCFDSFREFYPCLRIKRPKAIWISGYFSGDVGWQFGTDSKLGDGWSVNCKRGRRIGERKQVARDGLADHEWFKGRNTIKLPFPMKNPDWCEVNVEVSSPLYDTGDYELWWDSQNTIVDSEVQIRALSRRR